MSCTVWVVAATALAIVVGGLAFLLWTLERYEQEKQMYAEAPRPAPQPWMFWPWRCANGHIVPYPPQSSCQVCHSPYWHIVTPDEPRLDSSET